MGGMPQDLSPMAQRRLMAQAQRGMQNGMGQQMGGTPPALPQGMDQRMAPGMRPDLGKPAGMGGPQGQGIPQLQQAMAMLQGGGQQPGMGQQMGGPQMAGGTIPFSSGQAMDQRMAPGMRPDMGKGAGGMPGMGQQQGLTPWGQMSSAMSGQPMGGGAIPFSSGQAMDQRMAPGMRPDMGKMAGGMPPGMGQQPQGQMGALGGLTGGCPPWMPGCRGGGGYGGGGFAASMPFFGGSRPGLQAQQPARQTPPPPPSGGTTIGYSDAKLKQDIEPLEDGLELVNKLDPVRFNWIGSDAQTTGMIAQQVEEVLPGAVIDMGEGYKGIDGLAVIGALVGAIKTLTTRLETLEAR